MDYLVQQLSRVHSLCACYMDPNNSKFLTINDLDELIMNNNLTVTYEEAIENLKAYANISILDAVSDLQKQIKNSPISKLRLGDGDSLYPLELELDKLRVKTLFAYNIFSVISDLAKDLNMSSATIRTYCTSGRLKNTKKINGLWFVNKQEILDLRKRRGVYEYIYS